jgi:SulP family sulfate permease
MLQPTVPPPPPDVRATLVGDLWGGLAAMLVALPAAVAFGVAVYGPVVGAGPGALAGLVGAVALGIVAPLLGGTPKLVSAPCAPAVAVLSGFAVHEAAAQPGDGARVVVLLTLVGLVSAGLQLALGLVKAGTVIKYIPYPVVTGYLSGVGVVIFLKQLPTVLGLASGTKLGPALLTPSAWQWPALVVALSTIAVMVLAPRVTKAVPPAILGLTGGVAAYFCLGLVRPELLRTQGNPLVIGALGGDLGALGDALATRVSGLGALSLADLKAVLGPAATLAVLLSLDTLKTCVVVDAMTGSRHDSNRELVGQGVANGVAAALGGMPGAGTSGATLVNLASGAQTRWSAVIEGALVLVAFVALRPLVAWAPLAALSGILVVVAFRMFDWKALGWVRRRATALDFVVVVVVVATAVLADLITASAMGVGLSILLFIRAESSASVIHRKLWGDRMFSKQRRHPAELAVLAEHGDETVVVELAKSLFFGTTDQLRTHLERELRKQRTIVFDLRRVDAVDLTAIHILEQMRAQVKKRGGDLVFCSIPASFAGVPNARAYLAEAGLFGSDEPHVVFDQLSDALAWAEDRILAERRPEREEDRAIDLFDMPMFEGRKPETLANLRAVVERRTYHPGEAVFRAGDQSDEIYFVSLGAVRIELPTEGRRLHLATIGQGDFFGEITFLDGGARSADALAEGEVVLFALSRARFDTVAAAHPRLGQSFFSVLSRTLALRLRHANREISMLEEA